MTTGSFGGAAGGQSAEVQLNILMKMIDQGLAQGMREVRSALGEVTQGQGDAEEAARAHHDELGRGVDTMGQYEAQTSKLGQSLNGLKTGLAVGTSALTALGISQANADSKIKSFNLSMEKMGLDGKEVLGNLRDESLNMISDVKLATSATTAGMLIGQEALGEGEKFAQNFSDMLKVSLAAARATGQASEYMFESMILGVGRASPLYLDNLGITLKLSNVYSELAAELGKSEKELTMVERKTALLNAVLEQGRPYVEKYGISSGGLKTQLEKLEAASSNLALHWGVAFMPAIVPLIEAMESLVTLLDKSVTPAIAVLGDVLGAIPRPITTAFMAWATLTAGVKAATPILNAFTQRFGAVAGIFNPVMGVMIQAIPIILALASAIKQADGGLAGFLGAGENTVFILEKLYERFTEFFGTLIDVVSTFGDIVTALFVGVWESVGEGIDSFLGSTGKDWVFWFDDATERLHEIHVVLQSFYNLLTNADVGETFAERLSKSIDYLRSEGFGPLAVAIGSIISLFEFWRDAAVMAFNAVAGAANWLGQSLFGLVPGFLTVEGAINAVVAFVNFLIVRWIVMKSVMVLGKIATLVQGGLAAISGGLHSAGLAAMGFSVKVEILKSTLTFGLATLITAVATWATMWVQNVGYTRARTTEAFLQIVIAIEGLMRALWLVMDAMVQVGLAGELGLGPGLASATDKVMEGILALEEYQRELRETADAQREVNDVTREGLTWMDMSKPQIGVSAPWLLGPPTSQWETGGAATPEIVGGDGKAGKEKKAGGGDKAKKDPLQEAYQAISAIAGAISAGIDAINKLWAEWRGSPGPDLWDEVWATFDTMVQGLATLAEGYNPEEIAQAKEWASMVSGFAGSLGGVIDLGEALSRARLPSIERIDEVALVAGKLAEMALDLGEEFADGDIETSVKTLRFAADAGGVVGTMADSFAKLAEGLRAIRGRRMSASLDGIEEMMTGVLDLGIRLGEHAFAGRETPRHMIDAQDAAATLDSTLGVLTGLAEASNALVTARWPEQTTLRRAENMLTGVIDFAVNTMTRLRAARGSGFLVDLEDTAETISSISGWIDALSSVAEMTEAMAAGRWDVDLDPAVALVEEILWAATGITDAIRTARDAVGADDLLDHLDDLGLVGGAAAPWVELIGSLASVTQVLDVMAFRQTFGLSNNLGSVLDLLRQVRNVSNAILGDEVGADGRASITRAEDLNIAAGMYLSTIEVIARVGEALSSLRQVQAHLMWGQNSLDLTAIRGLLERIATMANDFYVGGLKLGAGRRNAYAESEEIASAFVAWLDVLSNVNDALQGLRLSRTARVGRSDIADAFDVLRAIAEESWAAFGEIMVSPGGGGLQQVSGTIAQSIATWVQTLTSMVDLHRALRTIRALGVGDTAGDIDVIFDAFDQIAHRSWALFEGGAGRPGFGEMQGLSQTVAGSVASWVGAMSALVEMSRTLRLLVDIDPTVWDVLGEHLDTIMDLVEDAGARFRNENDPGGFLERASDTISAVSGMMGAISDLAGLSRDVRTFIAPTVDEWRTISTQVVILYQLFERLVNDPVFGADKLPELAEEQAERWGYWAEQVGAAASALGSVAAIQLDQYLPPIERQWQQIEDSTKRIYDIITRLLPDGPSDAGTLADEETLAGRAAAFAQTLGAGVSAIADALSIQFRAGDVLSLSDDAVDAITDQIEAINALIESLYNDWAGGRRDPERDIELLESFGGFVSDAAGALADVVDVMQTMGGWTPGPSAQAALGRVQDFAQALVDFFSRWEDPFRQIGQAFVDGRLVPIDPQDVERARRENERTWQYLQSFMEMIGAGAGTLGDLVSVMKALGEEQLSLQDLTDDLEKQFSDMIDDTIRFWRAVGSRYEYATAEAQAAWQDLTFFANIVGALMGPFQDIVSTMGDLLGLKWEYFEANDGTQSRRLRDLELGAIFMDNLRIATHTLMEAAIGFSNSLPDLLGELDPEIIDARMTQLKERSEALSSIAGALGSIVDPIMSWFGAEGSGLPTFISRTGSNFWTRVRTNRAEWFAEQLEAGIVRTAQAITNAIDTIVVPTDADDKAKRLRDAVEAITTAFDLAWEIREFDPEQKGPGTFTFQIELMVAGINMLLAALRQFSGEPLDVAMFDSIKDAVDRIADSIERINGIEIDLDKLLAFLTASQILALLDELGIEGREIEWAIGGRARGDGPEYTPIRGFRPGDRERGGGGSGIWVPGDPGSSPDSTSMPAMPDIIVEMPDITVSVQNTVDARLTMSDVEFARMIQFVDEQRHRAQPSAPPAGS